MTFARSPHAPSGDSTLCASSGCAAISLGHLCRCFLCVWRKWPGRIRTPPVTTAARVAFSERQRGRSGRPPRPAPARRGAPSSKMFRRAADPGAYAPRSGRRTARRARASAPQCAQRRAVRPGVAGEQFVTTTRRKVVTSILCLNSKLNTKLTKLTLTCRLRTACRLRVLRTDPRGASRATPTAYRL